MLPRAVVTRQVKQTFGLLLQGQQEGTDPLNICFHRTSGTGVWFMLVVFNLNHAYTIGQYMAIKTLYVAGCVVRAPEQCTNAFLRGVASGSQKLAGQVNGKLTAFSPIGS